MWADGVSSVCGAGVQESDECTGGAGRERERERELDRKLGSRAIEDDGDVLCMGSCLWTLLGIMGRNCP